jgi:hypothetical protein
MSGGKRFLLWIGGFILVSLIVGIFTDPIKISDPECRPAVKIDAWEKGGFGKVGIYDFSIENTCPHAIKDMDLQFNFTAASGTQIGYARKTLYDTIGAGQKKQFKRVNIGLIPVQTVSSDIELYHFKEY